MTGKKVMIACTDKVACDMLMRLAHCCGFVTEVICDEGKKLSADDVGEKYREIMPELAFFGKNYASAAEKCRGLDGEKDVYLLSDGDSDYSVKLPLDLERLSGIFEAHGMTCDEKQVFYDLAIDEDTMTITLSGKVIKLTLPEIAMLRHFVNNPNRVFSREQLAYEVFGPGISDLDMLTENTVELLKQKLDGASGKWSLKLTWGVGYKFEVSE